jgi:hypothetical protein
MALALAFVSLAMGVKSSQDAKKTARQQAEAQKKQIAIQARAKHVAQQRAARVKIAEAKAAGLASGAQSSMTQGDIMGKNTLATANQATIAAEAAAQGEQIDLSTQQTVDQANAAIGQAVGTFGVQTLTPTGTDNLNMFERAFK